MNGRIALLGDAAHPMMPYLAQGGCMAIEDGYVLANALAAAPDEPEKALRAFRAARLPRASRVQLMSRKVAKVNQAPSLWARIARNVRMTAQKNQPVAARLQDRVDLRFRRHALTKAIDACRPPRPGAA